LGRDAGRWITARSNIAVAEQKLRGNLFGILTPPHQAGDFVRLHQPIHPQAEAVLIAVFAGTEIAAGADRKAAQRFAT
jgi:hypothetical protein